MSDLRKKLLTLFGSAALLVACYCPALGQFARSRPVHVYNPGTYSRTRATLSHRAAMRRALLKRQRAADARRRSAKPRQ